MKFYGARSAMRKRGPLMLLLEGNMGVGKSTFLNLIKDELHVKVVMEPVNSWSKGDKESNLLGNFYSDPARWAFTFQSLVFVTRIRVHIEALAKGSDSDVLIMDRSVYCDRFCFAKNCFKHGLMSDVEWDVYRNVFSWVVGRFMPRPDGIIYLRASPGVCLQRVQKRGRSEEKIVSLEYIKSLSERHDEWLLGTSVTEDHMHGVDRLILDATDNFEQDGDVREGLFQKVETFIEELRRQNSQVVCLRKCGSSNVDGARF